jgi:hypothetical protein
MKRMIAVGVLLAVATGCGGTKPGAVMIKPRPAQDQEYLAGFADGYRGVRPLDSHPRNVPRASGTRSYRQGVRDGYLTGRQDERQQK